MAALQQRSSGRFRIIFCFGGKRHFVSLKTRNAKEAEANRVRVEENLRDLERGRLSLPLGANLGLFLLSDGRLSHAPVIEKSFSLNELFDAYERDFPAGTKEANTRSTEKIHVKHFRRILDGSTSLSVISTATLQRYVDKRTSEKGRDGKSISHQTIKKEIGTLASIWNRFAIPRGFVKDASPTKGLVYRKGKGRPPFQSKAQIERQIARGGISLVEEASLWECLFLLPNEIDAVVEYVRVNAHHPSIYAMFFFAAHTGARRSEILRSRVDDIDFDADVITIREKKKDRSKDLTFRAVPLTPQLKQVLTGWFAVHPGGQMTFCRKANVPISAQRAAKTFRMMVDDSPWKVLSGWHMFRHSFASNCAMKGIDQRLIDDWLGHQTEEMRKRYRHLLPGQQMKSLASVFSA